MTLLRFLNIQGVAGIAVALALGVLLIVQRGETGNWKKQSGHFEQLYSEQRAALATTVANYRTAAEQARAADKANSQRVASEQAAINERTSNDYEVRLAAARSLAQRLRLEGASAAADPGAGRSAPMSGLPAAAGGPAEGAAQDGLPQSDRLTATEQAIQLDELIKWVRRQAEVKPNGAQR